MATDPIEVALDICEDAEVDADEEVLKFTVQDIALAYVYHHGDGQGELSTEERQEIAALMRDGVRVEQFRDAMLEASDWAFIWNTVIDELLHDRRRRGQQDERQAGATD